MKRKVVSCLFLIGVSLFGASNFSEYEEIAPDCQQCDSANQSSMKQQPKNKIDNNCNVVGRDMCTKPAIQQQLQTNNNGADKKSCCNVLAKSHPITITVTGQGVAPVNTISPAQAYALAKRAAIADAYRLIAEKVRGVEVEGEDLVKNMMVKRSTVRTTVYALVRNANITETTFRDGLCEVEMEIKLYYEDFVR